MSCNLMIATSEYVRISVQNVELRARNQPPPPQDGSPDVGFNQFTSRVCNKSQNSKKISERGGGGNFDRRKALTPSPRVFPAKFSFLAFFFLFYGHFKRCAPYSKSVAYLRGGGGKYRERIPSWHFWILRKSLFFVQSNYCFPEFFVFLVENVI